MHESSTTALCTAGVSPARYSMAGPQAEQEANAFASAFLMPRTSVMEHMPRSPLVQQILQGKKNWKVAGLALTYRLHELDMLSDWHYRRACIELGKLGYRRSEPSGMPSRERSQLLDKVFTARKAKGITLHDIARDLHVSPEELSSWVFGLVVTARTGSSHASADLAARERPRLSLVR